MSALEQSEFVTRTRDGLSFVMQSYGSRPHVAESQGSSHAPTSAPTPSFHTGT
jgi:hypothetical protein